MKYLISIVFCFFFAFTLSAQTQSSESIDAVIGYDTDQSYAIANLTATDQADSATEWTWTLRVKSQHRLLPYAAIKLDSLDGDVDSVTVKLLSKVSSEESYSERASETWHFSDTDTTMGVTTKPIETWNVNADSTYSLNSRVEVFIPSEFWQAKVELHGATTAATAVRVRYLLIKAIREG